jgi:hypothetical protein
MRTQRVNSVGPHLATRVIVLIGLAFAALSLTFSVIDWARGSQPHFRTVIIAVGLILGLVGNLIRSDRRELSYALFATSMALLIASFYR